MKNFNFNKAYLSTLLWLNQADQENKSILERKPFIDYFKKFKIKDSLNEIYINRFNVYGDRPKIDFGNFVTTQPREYSSRPKKELITLEKYQEFYNFYNPHSNPYEK